MVVSVDYSPLLAWEENLKQFSIGVVVGDVRSCHSWRGVQVAQATQGQKSAEVVLAQNHGLNILQTAATVAVEQVLLAARQEHISGLQ